MKVDVFVEPKLIRNQTNCKLYIDGIENSIKNQTTINLDKGVYELKFIGNSRSGEFELCTTTLNVLDDELKIDIRQDLTYSWIFAGIISLVGFYILNQGLNKLLFLVAAVLCTGILLVLEYFLKKSGKYAKALIRAKHHIK